MGCLRLKFINGAIFKLLCFDVHLILDVMTFHCYHMHEIMKNYQCLASYSNIESMGWTYGELIMS